MTRLSCSNLVEERKVSLLNLSHVHLHAAAFMQQVYESADVHQGLNFVTNFAGNNRNLEESFVMLAGSASLLKQAPATQALPHIPLQPLDSRFAQMARVFEVASGATKVWLKLQLQLGTLQCCPMQPAMQYSIQAHNTDAESVHR